jgi:hypothetical protein
MPSTICNIAKGRINEFVNRVNNNDPSTSGFKIVALQDTGLDTLDQLRDFDTLDALIAANTEASAAGYTRITLTDTDVAAPTVDDTNNLQSWDIGDFNFGTPAAGQNIQAAVIAYFPDTGGADSTGIPCAVTRLDTAQATNGETFHFRTPSGVWQAEEP